MNEKLQTIINIIESSEKLSEQQKEQIEQLLKESEKELSITLFKLDRTERLKRTTAVLLEQTIEELEQKRRSVEIQKRELEIEGALERVRTAAMVINVPSDMLEVCKVISQELALLGVREIRNVQTAIFYQEKGSLMGYQYYAKHDKKIAREMDYTLHEIDRVFASKMLKGKGQVSITNIAGEKVKEWLAFQKTTNEFIDEYLNTASSLNYYWYSLGPVALGISTYEPLSDEHMNLFTRFLKVFELAYTRYLDIEKAAAQAREAKIESALERVRARTMAMQRSDELSETSNLVFQQLKELGESVSQLSIAVINEAEQNVELWATVHGDPLLKMYKVPFDDPFVLKKVVAAFKAKQKSVTIVLEADETKAYNSWRNSFLERKIDFPEERWIVNAVFFSKGFLSFSSDKPCTPETIQLLERFANVFDGTYTRFLDLQNAEAQAREAQVQTSLERVRASAMAMHKSEDLLDVCETMYKEFLSLGFGEIRNALINIHNDADKTFVNYDYGELAGKSFNRFSNDVLPFVGEIIETSQRADDAFSESYITGKALAEFKELRKNSAQKDDPRLNRASDLYFYFYSIGIGSIGISTFEKITEEKKALLKRFRNVFNLSYQRYVDISKAEAQAREAQIELALERVRAKAMAMQKSEDLGPAVAIVFEELEKLNLGILRCGIGIINREKKTVDVWSTAVVAGNRNTIQVSGDESMDIHPLLQGAYDAWLKQKDFSYTLRGDDLVKYYEAVARTNIHLPESQLNISELVAAEQFYFMAAFQAGGLYVYSETEFSEESKKVAKRFANVFDLTYTRFLDLKTAEAQAREAQIEAALERVRSSAMAMHDSNDISSTTTVVFAELRKLNIESIRCGVALLSKDSRNAQVYAAATSADGELKTLHRLIEMTDHPSQQLQYESWLKQKNYIAELKGEELRSYYHLPFFYSSTSYVPPENYDHTEYGYYIPFSEGLFYAWTRDRYSENEINILNRFKTNLDLTFRRYLDLQKAEAQTREAKIEAALERVRAKAMAMHKSEDLNAAVAIVFEEMEKLDLGVLRCGISVLNKEKRTGDVWVTSTTDKGSAVQNSGDESFDIHPLLHGAFEAWVKQEDFYYILEGDDLTNYYKAVKAAHFALPESQFISSEKVYRKQFAFVAVYHAGGLFAFQDTDFTDEAKKLMKRFAGVFDLTYKRYTDIKLAEEQAREATIEAALERVRGKAMAMHNTTDLSSATSIAFTELRKLGINPIRFGVGLLSKENRKAQLYSAVSSAEGDSLALVGWVMLTDHPVLEEIYQSWLKNEDIFPVLSGSQLKSYYEQLLSGLSVPSVPDWQQGEKQFGHFFPFSVGCLYAWAGQAYSDAEVKILKRFASIIDLTFRRYMDLQKSEANAKEAVKQAALDRVRADIASMRTISDLDRITPLIWNELTILGVPFIRCGVFIMDEEQKLIHTFLSTPDGKAIAAFHLPFTTGGNIPTVIGSWQQKSIYTDHWDEAAFTAFANELVKQGALTSTQQYLSTLPKGGFYLHFLPFVQGMFYVGSLEKLDDDQIRLTQAVADAFSTAYARYEDFNKLEAAKQQVERTLVDLKQTQQQLVQSEKMASLGELTAGIAHEIQNPLNFVNNFSEVSNELIDEMKQELATGNKQLAIEIAGDVQQNLEKILHHGKRAGAIVKSMLQHSRSSAGKKELTDINALADEYLRLAYHGLRAKDKSFNAKFEANLDDSIGKINVVPQDIGRVMLNLINNAFYAVGEKKKSVANGYEPSVTVTTKNSGDTISIVVHDNGNGIPQKLIDKIFQPFFTTKPTGEGTGLGLSLSYDIITKGHGGELKVQTSEGQGSSFIILLPNHQAS